MLQKYQTTYFPIDGERVVTAMLPSGRFVAFFHDDGADENSYQPRGYGHTRLAAIADLNRQRDHDEPPDPPGWEGGFADNH